MRNEWIMTARRPPAELLASFGGAHVLKHPDGRLELRGGTEQDRIRAHQWLKQFLVPYPLTVRRAR